MASGYVCEKRFIEYMAHKTTASFFSQEICLTGSTKLLD